MSAVRRMIVLSDHGSLDAYRAFCIAGGDACALNIAQSNIAAISDSDRARVADLRMDLADWKADLAWVDEELARDRAEAHGAEMLGINDLRRRYENYQR